MCNCVDEESNCGVVAKIFSCAICMLFELVAGLCLM